MTGADLRTARAKIGELFGLGRPLYMTELGELLRLEGRDPGATIRLWEKGRPISGPASVAVDALLSGWRPEHWRDVIRNQ